MTKFTRYCGGGCESLHIITEPVAIDFGCWSEKPKIFHLSRMKEMGKGPQALVSPSRLSGLILYAHYAKLLSLSEVNITKCVIKQVFSIADKNRASKCNSQQYLAEILRSGRISLTRIHYILVPTIP